MIFAIWISLNVVRSYSREVASCRRSWNTRSGQPAASKIRPNWPDRHSDALYYLALEERHVLRTHSGLDIFDPWEEPTAFKRESVHFRILTVHSRDIALERANRNSRERHGALATVLCSFERRCTTGDIELRHIQRIHLAHPHRGLDRQLEQKHLRWPIWQLESSLAPLGLATRHNAPDLDLLGRARTAVAMYVIFCGDILRLNRNAIVICLGRIALGQQSKRIDRKHRAAGLDHPIEAPGKRPDIVTNRRR